MSDPVARLNAALEGPMGLLPASLLLLQLGCGILGPGNRLEPSELCSDHGDSAIACRIWYYLHCLFGKTDILSWPCFLSGLHFGKK